MPNERSIQNMLDQNSESTLLMELTTTNAIFIRKAQFSPGTKTVLKMSELIKPMTGAIF